MGFYVLVSLLALSGVLLPASAVRVGVNAHENQTETEEAALSECRNLEAASLCDWFWSSSGFDLSSKDALQLAQSSKWITLVRRGVTLDQVKALKDVAYSSSGLDLSRNELPDAVLKLAQVKADSTYLKSIRSVLYSSSGADFSGSDAKSITFDLVTEQCVKPTEQQLKDLLDFLRRSPDGPKLTRSNAQKYVKLALEGGVLADQLAIAYKWNRNLEEAMRQSKMVCKRYARDVGLYSMKKFQEYYGSSWLAEWQWAPKEKRMAEDGKAYSMQEFTEYYKSDYAWRWNKAPEAQQRAIAQGGKTAYTMKEFKDYYGDKAWQEKWYKATPARCTDCRK